VRCEHSRRRVRARTQRRSCFSAVATTSGGAAPAGSPCRSTSVACAPRQRQRADSLTTHKLGQEYVCVRSVLRVRGKRAHDEAGGGQHGGALPVSRQRCLREHQREQLAVHDVEIVGGPTGVHVPRFVSLSAYGRVREHSAQRPGLGRSRSGRTHDGETERRCFHCGRAVYVSHVRTIDVIGRGHHKSAAV